jgi:hypothetical protein
MAGKVGVQDKLLDAVGPGVEEHVLREKMRNRGQLYKLGVRVPL